MPRKDFRSAEQLVQLADTKDAGAPERRFVCAIGARERTRVGKRRLGAARAAPRLHHDDGFGAGGAAGRRHELRRVGDSLHVEQDGTALHVSRQIVQYVAEIDIGHVAKRDHLREADVAAARPIDDRRDQGSRLGHECKVAG